MRKIWRVAGGIMVIALWSAGAVQAERLTLKGCVKTAVQHNPTIQSENIAVLMAEQDIRATEGPFDWVLSLDGGFGYNDRPSFSRFEAGSSTDFSLSRSEEWLWNLAVSKYFVSGTDISLSFNNSRQFSSSQLYLTQTTYPIWLGLTVKQSFLKGFGLTPNQAPTRVAEMSRDISVLKEQSRVNEVIRQIETAYWELVYAQQDLRIRETSLKLARIQQQETEAKVQVGKLTETDLLAARHLVATQEESVLLATGRLEAAAEKLREIMGVPISAATTLELDPPSEPRAAVLQQSLSRALEKARTSNYDIRISEVSIKQKQVEIDASGNALLPTLDLSVSAGQHGLGTGYGDALKSTFTFKAGFFEVMLNFSYPLFNDSARAAHEKNTLAHQRARTDLETAQRELHVAVSQALRDLQIGGRRLKVTEVGLKLAKRKFESAKQLLLAGRITHQDVLQYLQELEDAELRRIRALVDCHIYQASLRALQGTLLADYRLQVSATRPATSPVP